MSTRNGIYNELRDNFLDHIKSNLQSPEKFLAGIIMKHLTGKFYVSVVTTVLNIEFEQEFGFNVSKKNVTGAVSIINVEIESTGKRVHMTYSNSGYKFFIMES